MSDFLLKTWNLVTQPLEMLGFFGQFVFFLRFAVQWIASERKKEIVVPEPFWWFSIIGGTITLAYGIMKPAPPVVAAQCLVIPIYCRNLVLSRRSKRRLAPDLKVE